MTLDSFLSLEFHTYQDGPEAAAKRLSSYKSRLAAGEFLLTSPGGKWEVWPPNKFGPHGPRFLSRWNTPGYLQRLKALPRLPIGGTMTLETGFHPRHGLKTVVWTRIA